MTESEQEKPSGLPLEYDVDGRWNDMRERGCFGLIVSGWNGPKQLLVYFTGKFESYKVRNLFHDEIEMTVYGVFGVCSQIFKPSSIVKSFKIKWCGESLISTIEFKIETMIGRETIGIDMVFKDNEMILIKEEIYDELSKVDLCHLPIMNNSGEIWSWSEHGSGFVIDKPDSVAAV